MSGTRWPEADTRFANRILIEDECWRWLGPLNQDGYGSFYWNGKPSGVHRFSYERFIGPIPDGLVIDHLCRNTWCVNPNHLEAVTSAENSRRLQGFRSVPTHCIHGHEYTPENTGKDGTDRYCRTCKRVSCSRTYYRRRARGGKVNAAQVTECKHGHPFTPENTYTRPDGRRQCRACSRRQRADAYRRRSRHAS